MKKLLVGCALSALAASSAYAQSTGSVEFGQEVVVTGSRTPSVGGVQIPETAQPKEVLTSTFIQRQVAGQSIDEVINQLPGVSYQNNDPYGSSGGTLTIRGFDGSRISQTWDGMPLNDTGNYALYGNQQLDMELIDQVNVNLGTTDVDSPTASATGSTVNYRTRNPFDDFHIRLQGSTGQYGYFRPFAVIDTGIFTPFGTKAFLAASHSENENPFQRTSKTDKWQINAKIYQPIGANGDFVSLAGHYNRNRNGNFSSLPLRVDANRVVGSASTNRFPTNRDERDYTIAPCMIDTPQTGVADSPNSCGTLFDQSFNPSNTGNIRANSRFTLADGLVLTVDPSYQYTKANGGTGAVKANEGFYTRAASGSNAAITTPIYGYIGGQAYFGGVDLNGDGDILDTPGRNAATGALTNTGQGVELYAPSHTQTHRIGVITSLRYDISPTQTVRINYTFDHGRHRQTGSLAALNSNGSTTRYFPIDAPILDANGNPLQKRNRLSYAVLNQLSGEYRGVFFDKLTVTAGLRSPWFTRKLNNYCVTEAGGSFVDCFTDTASQAAFLAANPTYVAPISRTLHFHKLLPEGGVTYDLTSKFSAFLSYSKGLQVPGTDNLYQSLAYAPGTAQPVPETTDNINTGLRYRSSKVQAQLVGWYTFYNNRLASAYDPVQDITLYRNLGKVHKYGVDADVAYTIDRHFTARVFGSYLKSKIMDNVQTGECSAANVTAGASTGIGKCTSVGQPIYALTEGKRESGAPVYTLGGGIDANFDPVSLGAQIKRTGRRYVNDQNQPIVVSGSQVFGAFAKGYTIVDLNARISLEPLVHSDRTYLQLNVTNLFDKFYVGGFSGNLPTSSIPFAYIGSPRAVSGTLVVGF
jgi:iron complex outermembrane receptor protein